MSHELDVIPHPDERVPLHQLREEFRAAHLADLRSQYAGHHPVGWMMIGDPATARDRYSAAGWAMEMLRRLDDPCTQDFGLGDAPATLGSELESLASKAALHDSVTWPDGTDGAVDQDAPPCDLAAMTDDQLADYVDAAIRSTEAR